MVFVILEEKKYTQPLELNLNSRWAYISSTHAKVPHKCLFQLLILQQEVHKCL